MRKKCIRGKMYGVEFMREVVEPTIFGEIKGWGGRKCKGEIKREIREKSMGKI